LILLNIVFSFVFVVIGNSSFVNINSIFTLRLTDFLHFIFIFTISNIFSRLSYDVVPFIETWLIYHFWWYIFYKLIKITVLRIEEKSKKQGE
jgi:hypothetical protein